jgi:hypothetical protein
MKRQNKYKYHPSSDVIKKTGGISPPFLDLPPPDYKNKEWLAHDALTGVCTHKNERA